MGIKVINLSCTVAIILILFRQMCHHSKLIAFSVANFFFLTVLSLFHPRSATKEPWSAIMDRSYPIRRRLSALCQLLAARLRPVTTGTSSIRSRITKQQWPSIQEASRWMAVEDTSAIRKRWTGSSWTFCEQSLTKKSWRKRSWRRKFRCWRTLTNKL